LHPGNIGVTDNKRGFKPLSLLIPSERKRLFKRKKKDQGEF